MLEAHFREPPCFYYCKFQFPPIPPDPSLPALRFALLDPDPSPVAPIPVTVCPSLLDDDD